MKISIGARENAFPNPVFVVCTYDAQGKPNAATLAWAGVGSSGPAALVFALRPARYTYENLLQRKAFTVNLPSAQYVAETDYFGIVSGRDADKFAVTGLTPVRSEVVDAPFIAEFPYSAECVLTHTLDLGVHTLFVGEVKDVKVSERLLVNNKLSLDDEKILTYDFAARAYRVPGDIVAPAFYCGLRLKN
ncbi:MAG: flavin reductase family protein [Oscillospiraceae bacterium]|jgi:flavin reductase (DIM6/NTAB) family NADH-FMN oxidoreductase RutF|nr:flavin reductase family protein [Oscillospiraceae bacterium]